MSDLTLYPALQAFAGHTALVGLCSAYISDNISAHNRAAAMGLNMAAFMAAFICGPLIGGFVSNQAAAWTGVVGTLIAMVSLWILVPESLSQSARDKVD